jgi:ABC-type proline/glycine betaine transport system permease subunit
MRRCSCSGSGSATLGRAAGRVRVGLPDHLQHLDRREGREGNLGALGAGDGRRRPRLFRHVILPGALPYILTGLRLGLAQAWRILVGVEMLAAVPWGLGWMIFGAREFLNMDVMLAGVAVIAVIGLALEKLVFQRLENSPWCAGG